MRLEVQGDSSLLADIEAIRRALGDRRPVVIRTSGTTGTPKSIEANLVAALERKRPGLPSERWLLTYSAQRWAGISVILHVIKSACTLCVPRSLSFDDLLASAVTLAPTCLSCTPSMFRNLVRHDEGGLLPKVPIAQMTFGGEAATQSVLDLARSVWPLARVSHVYASTELGDICSVSDGREGVPAQKFGGFTLTAEGELVVRGVKTGDFWELRCDRFYFLGRHEEIINVGGNKVSPLVVEEVAISRGALAAKAYGVTSPLMGALVALDYVGGPTEGDLACAFRECLPKYACPARLRRVERIELTEAGKTRRTA